MSKVSQENYFTVKMTIGGRYSTAQITLYKYTVQYSIRKKMVYKNRPNLFS